MTKVLTLLDKTKSEFKNFASLSFFQKCDIISLGFLFVFFIDCAFSGGGKLFQLIGPLTFRMLTGGLALLFSLPKLFKNLKTYVKKPIFYMLLAFVVFLGFCAIRGYLAKNHMGVLASDIKGFMWLFTVPALVVTVDTKERFNKILTAIVIGASLQAILVLGVYFACCADSNALKLFYTPMLDLQIGTVSFIADNVYRLFMRSSPYLITACAIIIFRQITRDKLKWHYIIGASIFLLCIVMSFTRSLFGATFIVIATVVLFVLIFFRSKIKMLFKSILCIAAVTIFMVSALECIYDASYVNFAISRTLGTSVKTSVIVVAKYKIKNAILGSTLDNEKPSQDSSPDSDNLNNLNNYMQETEDSDNIRAITKAELKELIVKNPIIGNGLGACSKTRNGPDEYFYYDMLARMGIIGLALYVAPFIYICIVVLKRRKVLPDHPECAALLSAMIGFWLITWFNPWMNAILGIAVYALSCSIVTLFKQKSLDKNA